MTTAAPTRLPGSRLLVAWATTLLLSRLPEIVLREAFALEVPWFDAFAIIAGLGLVAAASVIIALRPFRAYFVIMLTVIVLTYVVDPLVREAFVPDVVPDDPKSLIWTLFLERIVLVLEALAIVPVLLLLGYRGQGAYLALGRLSAPSGLRIGRRDVSWVVLGPVAMIGLVAMTAAFASATVAPTADLWSSALPLLPIAWAAAALNALGEEVLYRAAPLGPLASAVSARAAIVILAVWFGLGHWYGGIPSGAMGLVLAGSLALLFGKAMIDTRGLGWPWALHFSTDITIFTFIALGAVAAG